MARIAGVNIPDDKHACVSLTYIYGIGRTSALRICETVGVVPSARLESLSEAQLDAIRAEIAKRPVEGDLRREVQMSIKRLMDLCVYARWSALVGPGRAAHGDGGGRDSSQGPSAA